MNHKLKEIKHFDKLKEKRRFQLKKPAASRIIISCLLFYNRGTAGTSGRTFDIGITAAGCGATGLRRGGIGIAVITARARTGRSCRIYR